MIEFKTLNYFKFNRNSKFKVGNCTLLPAPFRCSNMAGRRSACKTDQRTDYNNFAANLGYWNWLTDKNYIAFRQKLMARKLRVLILPLFLPVPRRLPQPDHCYPRIPHPRCTTAHKEMEHHA